MSFIPSSGVAEQHDDEADDPRRRQLGQHRQGAGREHSLGFAGSSSSKYHCSDFFAQSMRIKLDSPHATLLSIFFK